MPSRRIADLEVVKIISIQSHRRAGKPLANRIRRRLLQFMESKALEKSNFNTRVGAFLLKQL
jgi:hypothetical protein